MQVVMEDCPVRESASQPRQPKLAGALVSEKAPPWLPGFLGQQARSPLTRRTSHPQPAETDRGGLGKRRGLIEIKFVSSRGGTTPLCRLASGASPPRNPCHRRPVTSPGTPTPPGRGRGSAGPEMTSQAWGKQGTSDGLLRAQDFLSGASGGALEVGFRVAEQARQKEPGFSRAARRIQPRERSQCPFASLLFTRSFLP